MGTRPRRSCTMTAKVVESPAHPHPRQNGSGYSNKSSSSSKGSKSTYKRFTPDRRKKMVEFLTTNWHAFEEKSNAFEYFNRMTEFINQSQPEDRHVSRIDVEKWWDQHRDALLETVSSLLKKPTSNGNDNVRSSNSQKENGHGMMNGNGVANNDSNLITNGDNKGRRASKRRNNQVEDPLPVKEEQSKSAQTQQSKKRRRTTNKIGEQ